MSGRMTPELARILKECEGSTEAFCKVMAPETFTRPFSPRLGRLVCEAIDDDSFKHTLILAPRSIGKSSIVQAACARRGLFRKSRFIVTVSAASDLATQQSEDIKSMLLGNETIKALWGDQQSDEWALERWTMRNGTHFRPRGYGQKVHGMKHQGKRPDFIIVDDLEDPDHMDSEDFRAKVSRWFWQSLYGCFDHSKKDWRIVVIGTMSHNDCILSKIMKAEGKRIAEGKKPKWRVVNLALCDEEFRSTDPNYMTDAEVLDLKETYEANGELDSFYRQFMNIPIAAENRVFHEEQFQYYDELPKGLETFVIMDPAKTAKIGSADTAIVGVGFDVKAQRFYVIDIERGKFHPDEMHAKAIDMALRLGAWTIGIEVTGLNEHVTTPLQNEIIRRAAGKIQIVELHARGKKEDRIKQSLAPLYRQGLIYHNKACCGVLEHQLLSFPVSELFDVMDAASYISEIVEQGGRFFDVLDETDEVDREYEGLDEQDWGEDVRPTREFGDDWMRATGTDF